MNLKPIAFAVFGLTSTIATAAPVVVTPGSMAGYTYFPPATATGGSGGGGTGENVSTLQRCLWAPSSADQTVTAVNFYDYDKPLTVYYKIAGGNGGAGVNGGGGGSSAILMSGAPVAVGPGGLGGNPAPTVAGTFSLPKNATLRFVTGGGGGAGVNGVPSVGGGGGAGYKGGGGGASSSSRSFTGSEAAAVAGKGGGTTPGPGGFVSGAMAGSGGNDMSGGIATYPDGSTVGIGTPSCPSGPASCTYTQSHMYYSWMGVNQYHATRWLALPNRSGSMVGVLSTLNFGGGGGMLGHGGSPGATVSPGWCEGSRVQLNNNATTVNIDDNGGCSSWYNMYSYTLPRMSDFPPHDGSMNLTRRLPDVPPSGGQPIRSAAGSLPGQIILMFQAPVCDVFQ